MSQYDKYVSKFKSGERSRKSRVGSGNRENREVGGCSFTQDNQSDL